MSVFNKEEKTEQENVERIITDELLTRQDQALQIEGGRFADINRDAKRATDETMILAYNITETRKLIVALREKMALVEFWRTKV